MTDAVKTIQYNCVSCNYVTNIRFNYDKHVKTKKHLQNITQFKNHNIQNDNGTSRFSLLPKSSHSTSVAFDDNGTSRFSLLPKSSHSTSVAFDDNVPHQENKQPMIVNFERFDKGVRSASKVQQRIENDLDQNIDKSYRCRWCNRPFANHSNLLRHNRKGCDENTAIVNNLRNEVNTLKLTLEHKNYVVQTLQETLEYERRTEKSQLSASNYLMVAYNNVSPLLHLSDFTIFEEEDRELIDLLLNAHNNNRFVEFVGDALVTYYKTANPQDQQLWNSDCERLTYFIRKNLEWSIDKQGIKTCDLIIDPALNYFKQILCNVLNAKIPQKSTKITVNDNQRRFEALELLTSIRNGTVQQKILKYIAPYLYLDKKLKYTPKLQNKKNKKRITQK